MSHPPLWFVADFEKRLIEEGAVTESLRGADRPRAGLPAGPPVDHTDTREGWMSYSE